MKSALASELVRRWVAVYTRGLPDDVRAARTDEIDSDLWSQRDEAGTTGRSDSAVAVEILARLVLGAAADVAWRVERGRLADRSIERSTSMGTRIVALLAVVGGVGLTVGVAWWAVTLLGNPGLTTRDLIMDQFVGDRLGGSVIKVVGALAVPALGLSLGGLGFILLSRFDSPVGLVAILCGAGGALGVAGAPSAVVLIPIGSIVVVPYLARIHAIRWSLALIHAASAVGFFAGLGSYSNNSLVGVAIPFSLMYSVTWIALGLELLRGGLPQARPAAPSAT